MARMPVGLSILVLAAVAAAPGTTRAGAEPGRPLGPAEAVRIALENHPLLAAADEEVRAAEADHRYAGSGYLPQIELSEDWMRSNNPVFVFGSKLMQGVFAPQDFALDALNDPDPFTNAQTALTVYQNIWDGGQTTLYKKAGREGIAAAEQTRDKTRDEVVFGALESFWNLVLAQEMSRVAQDAETAAEANLDLTRELVESGLAVASDRMLAEVRMAEVRSMRIRAESGVEVARAALLGALGLDQGPRFEPVPAPPRAVDDGDSLERRLEMAFAERSDLAAVERRIDQADYGVKIGRSGFYPKFGAIGRYELNGANPFGADGTNWLIGLSARWKVFDGNGTKARAARAQADRSRAEAMRTMLRQGIRVQVHAAWAERESARQRLEVAAAAVGHAEEALRIVRERYEEGLAMVVELLGTETALTQAQANHARALSESWLAEAGLDLASGADPAGSAPGAPGPGRV